MLEPMIYDATTDALDSLIDRYKEGAENWIIPFSGTQSSLALIELVFDMFSYLKEEGTPLTKKVEVVNSQTGIDFPHLVIKMNHTLKKIEDFANEKGYPITTKVVFPEVTQSFWVHVIGYGYPPPRSMFQWCASKMKLTPLSDYLKEALKQQQAVIVSSEREGDDLYQVHPDIPNAFLFSPLRTMDAEDVQYLMESSTLSIWNETNQNLLRFYKNVETAFQADGADGIKDERGVCGNTLFDYTFACWACPFKREHESLREFAKNAKEGYWLSPLLRYRGLMIWLSQHNENRIGRENKQMSYNAKTKLNEMKDYQERQSETLTMATRKRLLEELEGIMSHLKAEFFLHAPLIRPEEIEKINEIWTAEYEPFNSENKLGQIEFPFNI